MSEPRTREDVLYRYVIVGIDVHTTDGDPVRLHQMHGPVLRRDVSTPLTVLRLRGAFAGRLLELPLSLERFEPALAGGAYRLRSTGEELRDVDFTYRITYRLEPGTPKHKIDTSEDEGDRFAWRALPRRTVMFEPITRRLAREGRRNEEGMRGWVAGRIRELEGLSEADRAMLLSKLGVAHMTAFGEAFAPRKGRRPAYAHAPLYYCRVLDLLARRATEEEQHRAAHVMRGLRRDLLDRSEREQPALVSE